MGKISVETDNVFKIALPGFSVDDATPEQCAVHSGFDYPKIEENFAKYEVVTLPSSIPVGTTTIKSISHNYGYIPNAMVFISVLEPDPMLYNTDFAMLPFFLTDPPFMWYQFSITSTALNIEFVFDPFFGGPLTPGEGSPAGTDVGFKYQIWVND
jgi:hypothetical protein